MRLGTKAGPLPVLLVPTRSRAQMYSARSGWSRPQPESKRSRICVTGRAASTKKAESATGSHSGT